MKAHKLFLLLLGLSSATQRVLSASLREKTFETSISQADNRKISVSVVFSAELSKSAPIFLDLIQEAASHVRRVTNLDFQDSFSVFFDSRPIEHNGLATVIPSDWIFISTETPTNDESTAYSSDYLRETLAHELAHLVVLQQRRGFFRYLSWIFGNTSRPIGLWPRWLHEGSAVWVESYFGGRVGSGYIDYELRKFAEYYNRFSLYPVESYHLDGNYSLRSSNDGDMPYHLGFVLIDKIFKQDSQKFYEFVRNSSSSLGFLFQNELKKINVKLNEEFQSLREEIVQKHSKGRPKNNSFKVISKAREIIGPFSNGEKISWIEKDDNESYSLNRLQKEHVEKVSWKFSRQRPLSVFLLDDLWLVLTQKRKATSDFRVISRIILVDEAGAERCSFPIGERVREIFLRESTLLWIEGALNGAATLMQSEVDANCLLKNRVTVAKSRQAFERLSSPYLTKKLQTVYVRAQGRNTQKDVIVFSGNDSLVSESPLSHPVELPSGFCSERKVCWGAFLKNKNYWGPVIVDSNPKIVANLSTGMDRGAVEDDLFYAKQGLWDEDLLVALPRESFLPSAEIGKVERVNLSEKNTIAESSSNVELENYRSWESFWPRYWLPELYLTDGGMVAGGTSSWSDITNRWQADLIGAYDAYSKKPIAGAHVERNYLDLGPFSKFQISANYIPQRILNSIHEKWKTRAGLTWTRDLGEANPWTLSVFPNIEFQKASKAFSFRAYQYWVPGISLGIASSQAKQPKIPSFRLSEVKSSGIFNSRIRYFDHLEAKNEFTLQQAGFWNTGWQLQLEHGVTHRAQYPASFFELGGEAFFVENQSIFLSRGFPHDFVVAKQISRASLEVGYRMFKKIGVLPWNRFRFDDLGHNFVVETASFDSFLPESKFQMGRQYFTTLGTQFDLWGQLLHYVNFKTRLGIYRGFGKYGEWNFNLTLNTYLDLPSLVLQ